MSDSDQITRRGFTQIGVGCAASLAVACGDDANVDPDGTGGATSSSNGNGAGGQGGSGGAGGTGLGGSGAQGGTGGMSPTPSCDTPTADDIEGPFYTAGAPEKTDLTEAGVGGVRFVLEGHVRTLGPGGECLPLGDALLDVWQADEDGAYDSVGYVLRGAFYTDADGFFSFETIVPGNYLNGAQFRPAHIHVKVSARGFSVLTTQLYFEGDPYNDIDPWFQQALALNVEDQADGSKRAVFDFVLAD